MPLNIDFLQVLLHLFNFILLAGGLTLLLFNPITKFLAAREEHFALLAKQNEEAAAKNQQLRLEYEQLLEDAREKIAKQKTDSEKEWAQISAGYIKEAKEKAALILQEAELEAETRKGAILSAAQTELSELVVSAAGKLLSDTVTPTRNIELYDEFIRLAEDTLVRERTKYDKK